MIPTTTCSESQETDERGQEDQYEQLAILLKEQMENMIRKIPVTESLLAYGEYGVVAKKGKNPFAEYDRERQEEEDEIEDILMLDSIPLGVSVKEHRANSLQERAELARSKLIPIEGRHLP